MSTAWTRFAALWRGPRPAGAASYVVPFVVSVGASFVFANRLPAPPTLVSSVLRWIAIAVFSTIVFVATDRLVQRVVARSTAERSNLARATVVGLGGLAGAVGIALSSTSVVAFDPLSFADPKPFEPGDPFTGDPDEAPDGSDGADDAGRSHTKQKTLLLPKLSLRPAVFAAREAAADAGTVEESPETTETTVVTTTTEPPTRPDETVPSTTTLDREPAPTTTVRPVTATTTTNPSTSTTVKPTTTTTVEPTTTTTTKPTTTTSTTSTTTTTTTTSTTTTSTTSTTTTTVPTEPVPYGPLFLAGEPAGDPAPAGVFSLAGTEPPDGELPNYDPEFNEDPGLTLRPTEHGTWAEDDPERLARFSTTLDAPTWVKGPAAVTLYLAADDFVTDELLVEASIYHCRGENDCEKIKKSLQWFASDDGFTPVTFEYEWLNQQYAAGDRLEVRVATWAEGSERDLQVAFGTADFPAVVELSVYETY